MAGINVFSLLTLVFIVAVITAQPEPGNRKYPNKKQFARFHQNRKRNNPVLDKGRSKTFSKFHAEEKKTREGDEILSEYKRKYEERQDMEYTVHGVDKLLDLSNLTRDARSRHGCMTIMKRANKDRYEKISDNYMDIACNMYTEWGKNMARKSKFEPTSGQKQWLNSLGVDEKMKQMYAHAHDRRVARQSGSGRAIRKELRMMSDEERGAFQDAMQRMKNTYMDGSSKYDLFVNFHQANAAPSGHFGPGFLAYHREMLVR